MTSDRVGVEDICGVPPFSSSLAQRQMIADLIGALQESTGLVVSKQYR